MAKISRTSLGAAVNPSLPNKELCQKLSKYHKTLSSCDHSQLTETFGNTTCCFCTKLMDVICRRSDLTGAEFGEQYREWLWSQPDFIEAMLKAKELLTKGAE